VAPDDGSGGGTACDGIADGPFVENVTVDAAACVVYNICVTNTGEQVLDASGVTVSDAHLGVVDYTSVPLPLARKSAIWWRAKSPLQLSVQMAYAYVKMLKVLTRQ